MKKHALLITAICLFAFMESSYAQFNKNVVIAHRGAWKKNSLPENSIASLNQAAAIGCYGSEFDVHLTKDDSLVVNHDPTFYGVDIESSTYQELLAKEHPNGEKIPTAEAYLLAGKKNKKTKLIFEIKTAKAGKERTLQLTRMSVDLVKKLGLQKQVEYICFDYDAGKLVHQLDPKAKVAYLNGDIAPAQVKAAGYTGIDYHINAFKKNPEWIKDAHKIGLTVNVWTVNDVEDMKFFLAQRVDYITTNEPELLFETLKKK